MLQNSQNEINDVFFFGAGFSKAIDDSYPTLKDLTFSINNSYKTEEESIAKHIYEKMSNCYKKNIEELLTFLSANIPYKSNVQISSDIALYKDITNKIAFFFNEKIKKTDLNECLNKTQSLIEYILKTKSTCITLNYDMLLEQLLKAFAIKEYQDIEYIDLYNAPLSILPRTNKILINDFGDNNQIPRKNLPDIIKLHGSLNWGIVENNSDIVYYISDNDEKYKIAHLQTYIIPPVLDKTHSYSNHVIKAIWRRAYEKLSMANNIYIYGFSFPPTDLSVKFLFKSSLSNNKKMPKIYVINTEDAKKNIESIYNEIFKEYNIEYKYCCKDSFNLFIDEIIKPKLLLIPKLISKFSHQRIIDINNTIKSLTKKHIDILKKLNFIQSKWEGSVNCARIDFIINYFEENFKDIEINDYFKQILNDLDRLECTFILQKFVINDDENDNIVTKLGEDIITYLEDLDLENNNN
jgi:hypothetical protein